jgi:hypothetical protein
MEIRRCSSRFWIRVIRLATLTGVCVAHSVAARTVWAQPMTDRETLDAALLLAGRAATGVPLVLVSEAPDGASPGIQGWTTTGPDGRRDRVFLLTESPAFRCARRERDNFQCRLKLASVIVHEAWHFRHGGDEGDAYAAQITFLMSHDAPLEQIVDVRRSRTFAVAAERKAIDKARLLSARGAPAR